MDYAKGSPEKNLQFASMTSATQANYLRGDREYSTLTQYHNFSFTIGINLNIEKKDN